MPQNFPYHFFSWMLHRFRPLDITPDCSDRECVVAQCGDEYSPDLCSDKTQSESGINHAEMVDSAEGGQAA
ncbi:hypothetical protein KSZ_05400 [Dictyobacter formicarum]|uniref:Uncharacterized protein n=1 Tax=Dictyobacter formicarum TaxID=2778368 RepID=A0ABQ3V9L3_9CHLR|nr:hypothetical protein KSZ_05400 [Dictyobacter formicarum]